MRGRRSPTHSVRVDGDGGLATASVLLTVCASARRKRLDPWVYLTHVLAEVYMRAAATGFVDLMPDQWAKAHRQTRNPGVQ